MSDSNRSDYRYFVPVSTRWMDNDVYGHVNNVTYYSYFDTAANDYLIKQGGLDIHNDPVVGFVVASSCQYKAPIAFPDQLDVGVRVNKLGNRSVEYGIGIFKAGDTHAVAFGSFTHVFVDRSSQASISVPPKLRAALSAIHLQNNKPQ